MSATGRGAEYRDNGSYQTAIDDCRGLIRLLAPILATPQTILEPSVGDGNFLTALIEHSDRTGVRHTLGAIDIDPAAKGLGIARAQGGFAMVDDFLRLTPIRRPTLIVMNPPFAVPQPATVCPRCVGARTVIRARQADVCPRCKGEGTIRGAPIPMAERHIRRALEVVAPRGHVCAVLRLAFFETEDRIPFWREWGPGHGARTVYALARRLSFMGGPTDSSAYGFFCFEKGYAGPMTIQPLDHLAP